MKKFKTRTSRMRTEQISAEIKKVAKHQAGILSCSEVISERSVG